MTDVVLDARLSTLLREMHYAWRGVHIAAKWQLLKREIRRLVLR